MQPCRSIQHSWAKGHRRNKDVPGALSPCWDRVHNHGGLIYMGVYQMQTNTLVQTMQTPIRDARSGSKGHGEGWGHFADHRPPAPTHFAEHPLAHATPCRTLHDSFAAAARLSLLKSPPALHPCPVESLPAARRVVRGAGDACSSLTVEEGFPASRRRARRREPSSGAELQ
jgi:hypothetical protein